LIEGGTTESLNNLLCAEVSRNSGFDGFYWKLSSEKYALEKNSFRPLPFAGNHTLPASHGKLTKQYFVHKNI